MLGNQKGSRLRAASVIGFVAGISIGNVVNVGDFVQPDENIREVSSMFSNTGYKL